MKEAYLFEQLDDRRVKCLACSHYCRIDPGKTGRCKVRQNRDGTLVSLVYDRVVAASVDPIEKKPVFHFKPGSTSFSIATMGCNLKCRFCQNADIAQVGDRAPAGRGFTPEQIVEQALDNGCDSISYTYTEPSVFFELALDTARLAKEKGLYNIFVTNGFMSPELVEMASGVLDAANVDLKAYNEDFYRKLCNARLEPVKETLRLMKKKGILLEVTTLIIPGLNDDPGELTRMAGFIAGDLGRQTPWHLSRFHPAYKLQDRGATPVDTLETACNIGEKAGLYHVYTGNVPGARENTVCRACGDLLVKRHGYGIESFLKEKGRCPGCGVPAYGIY
ncbi:MAG: AmmeMemoRadiSam system radical SAM enzyme [Desulfobacterales bacterium]|nr:AmmeMemoRadiSam system radical SAM enzyme [Desulfobacterales bacterium]